MGIYEKAVELMRLEDIDPHESDLYFWVKKTSETHTETIYMHLCIAQRLKLPDCRLAQRFAMRKTNI